MAEKRVSVRIAATGGEQVRAAFTDVGVAGDRLSRRLSNVTSESRRMGLGVQNAAFQIGDFAVQVAGGTSATRAMAQQLPQLLGGFGILGAVAGAAAAILVSLAGRLFGAGEKAQALDAAIGELNAGLGAYEGYARTAATKTVELTEKFGEFAGQVRGFADYMAQVSLTQTFEKLEATVNPLKAGLAEVLAGIERVAAARALVASSEASPLATPEQILQAREALALYQDDLDETGRALGLLPEQAARLAAEMDDLASAKGLDEIARAAGEALAAIKEIYPAGSDLPKPLREAAQALEEMTRRAAEAATKTYDAADAADTLGDSMRVVLDRYATARTEAGALAQNTLDAARAFAEFQRQTSAAAQVYSGRGQDPRLFMDKPGQFKPSAEIVAEADRMLNPANIRGIGSSGALNETMREAKRIYDETRTAAEKYALEEERLNALRQSGAIDAETYGRAMEQLKNEYQDQGDMLRDVGNSVKGALSGVFDAIFDGGGKAIDVIKNLARELATMALEAYAFQALAGLFPRVFGAGGSVPLIGNAMGNAFDGGRVVPFASGGIVGGPTLFPMRGGAGLMGEAGPEAILPLTRVGGRLGVASGGGGTVVQIVNYTGAPVREERRRGPDGRELVVATIGEEMARGGFDGQMRRYGAQPTQVKR